MASFESDFLLLCQSLWGLPNVVPVCFYVNLLTPGLPGLFMGKLALDEHNQGLGHHLTQLALNE